MTRRRSRDRPAPNVLSPPTYRNHYADLVRRHLGRDPRRGDGVTAAALARCERRIGVTLPAAMRAYYLLAGRVAAINTAHNRLLAPDQWRVEAGHLWFMEESQAVVHWGLPLRRLADDDPVVYQRANVAGARPYSERLRFAAFVVRISDWQAGFADPL